MRILFDIPRLSETPLGMQTYIEHVMSSVMEIGPADFKFFVQTLGLKGRHAHAERVRQLDKSQRAISRHYPVPQSLFTNLVKNRLEAPLSTLFNVDIVHSFGTRFVPSTKAPLIVAIQDVIPLRLNEGGEQFANEVRKTLLQLSRRAQKVITISEFSKSEIAELLDLDRKVIEVIPNGVDTNHFKPLDTRCRESASACLRHLKIESPYLLCVGGNTQRKNKARLVQAFELLKARYKIPHTLVLAGSNSFERDVLDSIENCSYRDNIVSVGYLSQEQSLQVLQQAEVLVFPSTYEGFGLPPLEAMACGIPVAMSNVSAMPEVGGDAVSYFDPLSVESISDAILKLISDETFKRSCINKGLERAQHLSWDRNARQTIDLYKSIQHRV